MRIGVSFIRCGTCGKARGLTHTCVTAATSRRRATRTRLKPRVTVTCSKCGKPLGNPLTHVCVIRTDWRKRSAAAGRKRKASADAARRKAAAAKRRTAEQARRKAWKDRQRALERERREAWKAKQREKYQARQERARKRTAGQSHDRNRHEPQECADENCPRYPCRVWREAYETGRIRGIDEGYAKGYSDGYPDGQRDCPLPHQG